MKLKDIEGRLIDAGYDFWKQRGKLMYVYPNGNKAYTHSGSLAELALKLQVISAEEFTQFSNVGDKRHKRVLIGYQIDGESEILSQWYEQWSTCYGHLEVSNRPAVYALYKANGEVIREKAI